MINKIKIAVLPGDGIGKDVTFAALDIFDVLDVPVDLLFGEIGWECWRNEGNPIPDKTWNIIKSGDAVLLGATTSKPEREALIELPEHLKINPPPYISPIVQLRQNLDLYANIRPCFNITGRGTNFDFAVIRENTEGLYSGLDYYPLPEALQTLITKNSKWNSITQTNASCSLRLQTENGLQRLFKYAFQYAELHKYKRVTFADKPNVLRKSSSFAREIFENEAKKFPAITADIHNVDAVALWMVKRPNEFGVIVAENMFGDILSDLGAGIMGGLGFAPSANVGRQGCYFEPVHGSAPRVKSNTANPSAMFLTIALLLEKFKFDEESNRIKQAVKEVVREQKYVTYDLGGNATTQAMAKEIIKHYVNPRARKKISLLASGNELIDGNIQETNCNFFAKSIAEKGGDIYQHVKVSDKKNDIKHALNYLLDYSDAVIVTGGLGPTTDDNTRFAIAEAANNELVFVDKAWDHVVSRLEKFNLTVTDVNKRQALFPEGSDLYVNENGTACGAHISLGNKDIFMLPGPPKECSPMFEKFVVPHLEKANFFSNKKIHRWLTIGLIEGEICPQIENITRNVVDIEIGYCWSYPYLQIKLETINENEEQNDIFRKIDSLINDFTVSKIHLNSFDFLNEQLEKLSENIYIIDHVTDGLMQNNLKHHYIKFEEKNDLQVGLGLYVKASPNFHHSHECSGSIKFEVSGYLNNQKIYQDSVHTPHRNSEVLSFAKAYIAWQLGKFINSTKGIR